VIRDPYKLPAFSLPNRLRRLAWYCCYILLFRFSPKPFHFWRRFLLRVFGAKIGMGAAINQTVKVWAPWNLVIEDMVALGEKVEIYNPSLITMKSHAIVSQGAYLCGASHDYNDPRFYLFSKEIILEPYSWVCARAMVLPGVTVGEGAVLALGSVASKDIPPWSVYAGNPAGFVKARQRHEL